MRETLKEVGSRRKRSRVVRHALAHAVLSGLVLCGGVVLMTAPGLSELLRRGPFGGRSPHAAARALESLYKKGFVILTGSPGARVATLTDAGVQAAHAQSLVLPRVTKSAWDGLWYMVAFDIPVEKRKERNALRIMLKRLGFREYQKSLYLYPVGCESEIDFVATYFKVGKHVKKFYATDLDDEYNFRKHFKLS